MALISCSVFKDKIMDGTKWHTIRPRKNPPKVGESLYIWWKSRTTDREFLGISPCTQVDSISINPVTHLVFINNEKISNDDIEQLSANDGFNSIFDFWDFFKKPTTGFLIYWNPNYINRSQLRPEVVQHAQLDSDAIDKNHKIYSPSNGTEGMDFASHWCEMCDRDKDKNNGCRVLMLALCGSTPHWIQHEGQGICTSFVPFKVRSKSAVEETAKRSLERKGQLNLLKT
jgi:hypothetical protein